MVKTTIVQETTCMWHSSSKGEQPGQESAGSLKRGSCRHFLS